MVELLQDRPMEALADSIGLRGLCLGFCMIDIVDGQEQLIVVGLCATTVFCSTVGEYPQQADHLPRRTVIPDHSADQPP